MPWIVFMGVSLVLMMSEMKKIKQCFELLAKMSYHMCTFVYKFVYICLQICVQS